VDGQIFLRKKIILIRFTFVPASDGAFTRSGLLKILLLKILPSTERKCFKLEKLNLIKLRFIKRLKFAFQNSF
jgi:hypothetical protein